MPSVSMVVPVTNFHTFEKCLTKWIIANPIQIRIIDNSQGTPLPILYNQALETSKDDYTIFCHQDVTLTSDWLPNVQKTLQRFPAILGVAGLAIYGDLESFDQDAVGLVYQSVDKICWKGQKGPNEVEAVDECVFVVRKDQRFDENLRFNCYAADISLRARHNKELVLAQALPVIHHGKYSGAHYDATGLWRDLIYLYTKWRSKFESCRLTYGYWDGPLLGSLVQRPLGTLLQEIDFDACFGSLNGSGNSATGQLG